MVFVLLFWYSQCDLLIQKWKLPDLAGLFPPFTAAFWQSRHLLSVDLSLAFPFFLIFHHFSLLIPLPTMPMSKPRNWNQCTTLVRVDNLSRLQWRCSLSPRHHYLYPALNSNFASLVTGVVLSLSPATFNKAQQAPHFGHIHEMFGSTENSHNFPAASLPPDNQFHAPMPARVTLQVDAFRVSTQVSHQCT